MELGGKTGVFDVEELVDLLKKDKAKDVCVIKMPSELNFGNYMVIVSAMSFRHMKAMAKNLKKIYKLKKKKKDAMLKIEGEKTKEWMAFDLRNIILHVFMPEARHQYDLETLWTVGEEYDEKSQDPLEIYAIDMTDLEWLEALENKPSTKEGEMTNTK